MVKDRPRYFSYLLRFWLVEDGSEAAWRASLEDPKSGERRGFPSLEALYAYLIERTRSTEDKERNIHLVK